MGCAPHPVHLPRRMRGTVPPAGCPPKTAPPTGCPGTALWGATGSELWPRGGWGGGVAAAFGTPQTVPGVSFHHPPRLGGVHTHMHTCTHTCTLTSALIPSPCWHTGEETGGTATAWVPNVCAPTCTPTPPTPSHTDCHVHPLMLVCTHTCSCCHTLTAWHTHAHTAMSAHTVPRVQTHMHCHM